MILKCNFRPLYDVTLGVISDILVFGQVKKVSKAKKVRLSCVLSVAFTS